MTSHPPVRIRGLRDALLASGDHRHRPWCRLPFGAPCSGHAWRDALAAGEQVQIDGDTLWRALYDPSDPEGAAASSTTAPSTCSPGTVWRPS